MVHKFTDPNAYEEGHQMRINRMSEDSPITLMADCKRSSIHEGVLRSLLGT